MSPSKTWFRRPLAALLLVAFFSAFGCASSDDLPEEDVSGDVGGGNGGDDAGADPSDASTPDGGDAAIQTECEVFAPDCAEDEKCVPLPQVGTPICVDRGTETPPGGACSAYNECQAGSACASFEGLTSCLEMCDPTAEVDTCAGETYCGKTLGSNPDIGLCVAPPTPCNIYEQDCEAPQSCILTSGADGELGAFCGQAGSVGQGEACSGGQGRCQEGFICVSIGGSADPTCQPVCRPGASNPPNCPTGMSCDGFTSSSNITFCT